MCEAAILVGDCLEQLRNLPDNHVHACVTSPPYFGLRDYGAVGQIGLEATPDEFVAKMVEVFREVRRVLRDDGTLWLNIGDSYARQAGREESKLNSLHTMRVGQKKVHEMGAMRKGENKPPPGLKPKDLIGIPWRVAFALQADGWYLRQDIIWHKPNPMPESVRDRCTKAHEYIFLLSKSEQYYFDHEAMQEEATMRCPGNTNPTTRNRRSVWTVQTKPFKGAHFATFPPALVDPCILAGAPEGGVVLDPFNGAGTTGLVALRHQRNYIGCELNPEYAAMAEARIRDDNPMLNKVRALRYGEAGKGAEPHSAGGEA